MVVTAIKSGIFKGLRTALMLLKIMIPIYLVVVLLKHTELFSRLADFTYPAMRLFGLPGEAVVPLVTGCFSDEYSVAAAMAVFPFSKAAITTVAMITLCFHSIPVEVVVTRKIGMPAFRITLFRVGLAIFTGIFCAWLGTAFLGGQTEIAAPIAVTAAGGFYPVGSIVFDATPDVILSEMGLGVIKLVLNLLRIIIPLMVGIELLLAYRITDALAKKLTILCRLLGLGHDALLPLLVGLLLGVTYGAGALSEMNRTNPLPKRDMALLGVFLFSCHGIIETTYLFAVAGGSVIVLSAVRLAIALAVTAAASRTVLRR